VQDVVQLIDHLGGPVHLVAHDWGGALAWELASHHPDLVRSLSALNAPPLSLMLRSFTRMSQLRRSWYMFFFQLPVLPERWLSSDPETMVRRSIFQAAGRREVFDDESLAPYVEQVRAGFKGIDWYRGAMLSLPTRPQPIQCPVQILWGLADPALEAEVFADPERYAGWVDDLQITRLPGIGHWIQQEAPDVVSEAIERFINRG
jgi:pimeloyl-ACP methyl ester carboxylesterase